jgi:hypothetical protein
VKLASNPPTCWSEHPEQQIDFRDAPTGFIGKGYRVEEFPSIPDFLVSLLLQGRIVLFVGAGASRESPSDIESASQLAQKLIDAGYGKPSQALEQVADDIFAKGGEQPWILFGRLIEDQGWRGKPCNDAHKVMAELAKEGLIRWIMTTNWDLLIESALSQTGVDHSVLMRAEDFGTQSTDRPIVTKLHGCLTKPEHIKVTTDHMDSREWLERWAGVLFETVVRGSSLVFVGYSGSSRAVSATLKTLLESGHRSGPDYLVDIRNAEEVSGSEEGARLIAALQLEDGNDFDSGSCNFFRALREAVYPKLLTDPYRAAQTLVEGLVDPTPFDSSSLAGYLETLRDRWAAAGSAGGQSALLMTFSGFGYDAHANPYVPIRKHKDRLAEWWSWITVALWAESVAVRQDLRMFMAESDREVVSCVCPESQRRDSTALRLQAFVTDRIDKPGANFLGVVLGGTGPLPERTEPFSVSRGSGTPSVARGGGTSFTWMKADDLLEQFRSEYSEEEVKASAQGLFRDFL